MEMLIDVAHLIGDAEYPNLLASFFFSGHCGEILVASLVSADKYWED